ncbi:MAG: hypothetical protein WC749_12800 [Dehalococcoidia bacterium]
MKRLKLAAMLLLETILLIMLIPACDSGEDDISPISKVNLPAPAASKPATPSPTESPESKDVFSNFFPTGNTEEDSTPDASAATVEEEDQTSTPTATMKLYDKPFVKFIEPSGTHPTVNVKPGGSVTVKVETMPNVNVYNVAFVSLTYGVSDPAKLPSARSGSDGIAGWRMDVGSKMAPGDYTFTVEVTATDAEVRSQLKNWSGNYDPRARANLWIHVE